MLFVFSEMYADHPEKRRKRSSLFFRKKKDKSKTKGQSTNCDGNLLDHYNNNKGVNMHETKYLMACYIYLYF